MSDKKGNIEDIDILNKNSKISDDDKLMETQTISITFKQDDKNTKAKSEDIQETKAEETKEENTENKDLEAPKKNSKKSNKKKKGNKSQNVKKVSQEAQKTVEKIPEKKETLKPNEDSSTKDNEKSDEKNPEKNPEKKQSDKKSHEPKVVKDEKADVTNEEVMPKANIDTKDFSQKVQEISKVVLEKSNELKEKLGPIIKKGIEIFVKSLGEIPVVMGKGINYIKRFFANNEIARLSAILCLITSITAFLLATVNSITSPIIEDNKRLATTIAMKALVSEAEDFILREIPEGTNKNIIEFYEGKNGDKTVGFCVKVMPYGYGGVIELVVGINDFGEVVGTQIINHSETPGLGSKIVDEKSFAEQFISKSSNLTSTKSDSPEYNEITIISGATISSKAMIEGVSLAINFVNNSQFSSDLYEENENEQILDLHEVLENVLMQGVDFNELEIPLGSNLFIKQFYEGVLDDEIVGYCVEVKVAGYIDDIEMVVGFDNEGAVIATQIINHNESENIGAEVIKDEDFMSQFVGKMKSLISTKEEVTKENEVEIMTGATTTSIAITQGVSSAIEFVNSYIKDVKEGDLDE